MKNGFKAFLIYLLVPTILLMVLKSYYKTHIIGYNLIVYVTLLLIFLLMNYKDMIPLFKDFKKNYKKYLPIIIKNTLICFLLMMVSNYIIQLFIPTLPSNEINNRALFKSNFIISFISLVLLAPMVEEFVFRYSFKSIKKYWIYMVTTCTLFALLHVFTVNKMYELLYIITYFIIGFGFSNIFFKTKNYYASLISHILHNLLCVIIICIGW